MEWSRNAAAAAVAFLAAAAAAQQAPVCEQDASVTERFIPVELLTGLPAPEKPELVFAPVRRSYPFVNVLPDGRLGGGEVTLEGPVRWTGEGGKDYEVYERKVPRAHERFAFTPDRTAIGRVYDERFGNAVNEGKFPVGLWQQGQKRSYATVYGGSRRAVSSITIEKLSCTYEGVAGALQYRWTSNGLDYGYIYAPGRGVVQVMTYRSGR
ncbi:MAG TPA: hypothetical protein VF522_13590 [Ramlibacter sp.]|uniref:hypothetical protein n=1 Tax=Ramlibacter sp. TaxID=1917967 RepID=UPI002ED68F55